MSPDKSSPIIRNKVGLAPLAFHKSILLVHFTSRRHPVTLRRVIMKPIA
jgi:hypothetical protein